jgi:hypothetical protein
VPSGRRSVIARSSRVQQEFFFTDPAVCSRPPGQGARVTRACEAVDSGEHQAVVLAAVLPGLERSAGTRRDRAGVACRGHPGKLSAGAEPGAAPLDQQVRLLDHGAGR